MRPRRRPSPSTSRTMITPFRSLRRRSANRSVLLALTGAGLFLASLDAYVVVTALLPMLKSVNIAVNRPEQATPIITGFLLGYLAIMPIAGGLSDRFGRLRLFAVCLLLFAFGSFLTATAPSLSQLVTGRVLQGAGGGALVPAVLALAADLYPAGDRSPVLGAVSALQEIGSVLGPLWGGLITASSFGWTWIFWINIPAAALLLWALWPEVRAGGEERRPANLDWLGALLATAGLSLLTLALYAATPEQSPVGDGFIWQLPAAIVCFGLFVWHERRTPHLLGSPLTVADGELLLTGFGLGLEIAPVSAALLDAVGETERGAGASFLIVMRLVGMLVGFSLVAGFSLWEFHRATAHLIPPLPGLNPNFATQYAIYVLKVKQAIFDEYHLIFRATAVALFIGALLAALTLRPLPRPRWR